MPTQPIKKMTHCHFTASGNSCQIFSGTSVEKKSARTFPCRPQNIRQFIGTLKSQAVVYKDYMYPVLVPGKTGNQNLAAYGVGGLAVHAGACFGARSRKSETLCIDRSRNIPCAFHGTVYVGANFVHADDEYDLFGPWAMADTLFEFPSMFTMTPSSVIAFALARYTSAS